MRLSISPLIKFNHGSTLHQFWGTATYWLKIAYFTYPSLIRRPRSLCFLWNFALKLTVTKRVLGLFSSEDRMIVAWVVLTQWECRRVTDRQTDGFTITSTALCICWRTVTRKLSYRKDDRAMPPIWMPWKLSRVPEYAHGYPPYFCRNF